MNRCEIAGDDVLIGANSIYGNSRLNNIMHYYYWILGACSSISGDQAADDVEFSW